MPDDKSKDLQLKAALDLLHGVKVVTNVKPKEASPANGQGNQDTQAN